jgi:hypothetical protein
MNNYEFPRKISDKPLVDYELLLRRVILKEAGLKKVKDVAYY